MAGQITRKREQVGNLEKAMERDEELEKSGLRSLLKGKKEKDRENVISEGEET